MTNRSESSLTNSFEAQLETFSAADYKALPTKATDEMLDDFLQTLEEYLRDLDKNDPNYDQKAHQFINDYDHQDWHATRLKDIEEKTAELMAALNKDQATALVKNPASSMLYLLSGLIILIALYFLLKIFYII